MTVVAATRSFAIPSISTLIKLFAGGAAGLFVWELWARLLTAGVLGYPLEPAGLIDALFNHNFGIGVNYWVREFLHYVVGIVGYPVMYYAISRYVLKWGLVLDVIVFVTFTIGLYFWWPLADDPERTVKASLMFVFYCSVLGLIATRFINKDPLIADAISWGNYTWLNALGIMAPLGGLSFYLLGEVNAGAGALSYMSFVGHVIYGAVAAYVFEVWEGREKRYPKM